MGAEGDVGAMISNPIIQLHTKAGGRFRYDAENGTLKPARDDMIPPATGETVEIKTLVSHAMETGRRKDREGQLIARNIVNKFSARLDGETVFEADLNSAIAANPYISFHVKVPAGGRMDFEWVEDTGEKASASFEIPVA